MRVGVEVRRGEKVKARARARVWVRIGKGTGGSWAMDNGDRKSVGKGKGGSRSEGRGKAGDAGKIHFYGGVWVTVGGKSMGESKSEA